MMRETNRTESGQGWIALCLMIAIFIILPLGLLAFDLSKYYWASLQMRSAVDAAALSGVATLASGDSANDVGNSHRNAAKSAWETFKRNSIFGTVMDTALDPVPSHINAPQPTSLPVGQSEIYIDLLDINRAPLATWNSPTAPRARVMRVHGYQGYRPTFGQYLGFGDLLLVASSDGAVPTLDLLLCFDISGSMDDNTPVEFINRRWDGGVQRVRYDRRGRGTLAEVLGLPTGTHFTGTPVNVLPPQNLRATGYGYVGTKKHFSEMNWNPVATHRHPATQNMRSLNAGVTEAGSPPGNYNSGTPTMHNGQTAAGTTFNGRYVNEVDEGDADAFTDLIVRIDGKTDLNYTPTTHEYPSGSGVIYSFPSLGSLVEASRGNLDWHPVTGGANFTNSMASTGNGGANSGTMPTVSAAFPNYKAAYEDAVQSKSYVSGPLNGQKLYNPIGYSRDAASSFFNLMFTNTDAHFGFVAFTDAAGAYNNTPPVWTGSPASGTSPYFRVDQGYTKGGTQVFNVPYTPLDQASSNYATVDSNVKTLTPLGQTNIADSLKTALDDLLDPTKYRRGSKKAIVLFTDGIPNMPSPATAQSDCITQANRANANKIPIYCIGLADPSNATLQTQQQNLLGEHPAGIAGISKGKYFQVTSSTSLNDAFRVIARQLVQLTVAR
jgi:hypothetical protein